MEIAKYRLNASTQAYQMQWTELDPITGDGSQDGISHATDPLGGFVPGFAVLNPNADYGDLLGDLKGRVYRLEEPRSQVRIIGRPPLEATVYELEALRCNLCGEV